MIVTSAPLLSKLRDKGSTFYTFSSAINDIDKTLLDSNIKMAPSKFICMNIPQWKRSDTEYSIFEEYENIGLPNQTDPNIVLPKVIQNYIENALALHYPHLEGNSLQTVTESIFWNMMQRMGCLTLTEDSTEIHDGVPYSVFKEYEGLSSLVKYVGDVNILNHVTKDGQSYSELFLHIPQQAQFMPNVYWRDTGFKLDSNFIPTESGPYYTVGLEDHPTDNTKAIYDTDDLKYDFSTQSTRTGIYFDKNKYPEPSDPKENFDFNAILLYYDIWSDLDKTKKVTNLYGVLFIDKFRDSGSGAYVIPPFEKLAPSNKSTGNGFATRLIIKTTANTQQTTSEVSINDYSTVSMELYLKTLQELNKVNEKYEDFIKNFDDLNPKINQIIGMLNRIEVNENLISTINSIKSQVDRNTKESRISNEDLFTLFGNTINLIKASPTSNINVQYVSGNYFYDDADGLPFVLDPNNKRWKWNSELGIWIKLD